RLSPPSESLPLSPHMLAVRAGCALRARRRHRGSTDARTARTLPPLESRRLRPRAVAKGLARGSAAKTSARVRPLDPAVVRLPGARPEAVRAAGLAAGRGRRTGTGSRRDGFDIEH